MENLGEQIYKYRTKRGLSQLELAELLDVSRQSISKWETNVAVPELAKLVKMAEVFEITLDELILDKQPAPIETREVVREVVHEAVREVRKEERPRSIVRPIIGGVFLLLGLIIGLSLTIEGAFGSALVFMLPCIICAVICFKQLRYAALWCLVPWYYYFALLLKTGTGVTWELIRRMSYWSMGYPYLQYALTAWALFLVMVALIVLTVFAYRKHTFSLSQTKHIILGVGALLAFPLRRLALIAFERIFYAACGVEDYGEFFRVYYASNGLRAIYTYAPFAIDVIFVIGFTICLVPTFYWLKGFIKEKRCELVKKKADI